MDTSVLQQIQAFLHGLLEPMGVFLVDLSMKQDHRTNIVTVLVDTDQGISVGQCAEISRALGKKIEESAWIDTSYRLDVSSPGIDVPLRLLRQFPKNIGRDFHLRFSDGTGERSLLGKLTAVTGTRLNFDDVELKQPIEIEFEQVLEAKERLPW